MFGLWIRFRIGTWLYTVLVICVLCLLQLMHHALATYGMLGDHAAASTYAVYVAL